MTSGKNDNGSAKLVPDVVHNGQLFTGYYLSEGIRETAEFNKITDKEALNFADNAYNLLETHAKSLAATLNEAQTAHNVIFPILGEYLGWEINPQVRTSATDIPDAVLYHSGKKAGGAVILENKKLHTQLDRRQGNSAAPSSQMLRYLRNAENIDWGILTDGALWRLYYRRANSKSEQFLELKPGTLLAPTEERREHWAKVFMLMFGRDSMCRTRRAKFSRNGRVMNLTNGSAKSLRNCPKRYLRMYFRIWRALLRAIITARRTCATRGKRQ